LIKKLKTRWYRYLDKKFWALAPEDRTDAQWARHLKRVRYLDKERQEWADSLTDEELLLQLAEYMLQEGRPREYKGDPLRDFSEVLFKQLKKSRHNE